MEKFGHFKEMVNQALDALDLKSEPKQLYDPISYIIRLGGKRLRPVLTLAAYDLFGENPQEALSAAIGIEVFHNFTLLHDDIMDKADLRRGQETVHKKWNPNIAILSGDTMFALAYRQMFAADISVLKDVLETFTQSAIDVCEGQQFDMDFETSPYVTIPEYINMIRLKTAVLLGCSLKVGALIAKAKKEQAQLLYDFGVNIGLAFQLRDDLLDAFGEADKFGKSIGGDIAANKKTFLYLKCLELANEPDKNLLTDLFNGFRTDNTDKIDQVLSLYNKYNIREETTDEMEKYFGKAIRQMESLDVPNEKKTVLMGYAEWLFKRDH